MTWSTSTRALEVSLQRTFTRVSLELCWTSDQGKILACADCRHEPGVQVHCTYQHHCLPVSRQTGQAYIISMEYLKLILISIHLTALSDWIGKTYSILLNPLSASKLWSFDVLVIISFLHTHYKMANIFIIMWCIGRNYSSWATCIVKFCFLAKISQDHSYISPGTN